MKKKIMVPVNFSFHRSIFQYYLSGSEVLSNYRSVDAGMAETRANNALASREFQTKQPAQRKVTVATMPVLNIKWVSVDRKKNGRRYDDTTSIRSFFQDWMPMVDLFAGQSSCHERTNMQRCYLIRRFI